MHIPPGPIILRMIKAKLFYTILVASALLTGCSRVKEGWLFLVKPDKTADFNYPYFLFIPDDVPGNKELYLIVEPNNSGFVDDRLKKHIEKAKRTASREYYIGNYVSRRLKTPLLVPVFPRPESRWRLYTHALDSDVMNEKNSPLERIDLQLLAMIEDARIKLVEKDICLHKKVLLTGFSASGTFVNRFTLLHPRHIHATAAGGLNGLLILPYNELKGRKMIYPAGTEGLEKYTHDGFDFEAFREIPQFYFMGAKDDNDAVLYDDAFTPGERKLIYEVIDSTMMPARWNTCRTYYHKAGINARIETYDSIGHAHPEKVKDDILSFFREAAKEK